MSLAQANRKYFDQISDSYDSKPWFAKTNDAVTNALRARLDWVGIPFANTGSTPNGREVRQLDYACGTGLMSRVFGPYVTLTRGIDVSPNMVTNYNSRAAAAGLPPSSISAVVGDLFDKSDPNPTAFSGPEWYDFDLATVGFAFHHFEDVVYATKCLKERLRPGGALVINDFLQGGDMKADEQGEPIPGTEGERANHHHHHHHHHHHGHGHGQKSEQRDAHHHQHQHGDGREEHPEQESEEARQTREASIVIPNFSVAGLKKIFTDAGLVDVDVVPMEPRVYMEFAGQRLWRTILLAKGRRPMEDKSEL